MTQNVGTSMNPVSFLHQRAVSLLYDELSRPRLHWKERPFACA